MESGLSLPGTGVTFPSRSPRFEYFENVHFLYVSKNVHFLYVSKNVHFLYVSKVFQPLVFKNHYQHNMILANKSSIASACEAKHLIAPKPPNSCLMKKELASDLVKKRANL
jgi:hypothetical protein